MEFDAQRRRRITSHLIYRVLTTEGVSGWSSVQESYAPWYQDKPQIRARVITPDEKEHRLDPDTLVEEGSGGSGDMFSSVRSIRGPLPSLEPGSVVEEYRVLQDHSPYFAGGTSGRYLIYNSTFTEKYQLIVEAPTTLPLRYKSLGGAPRPKVTHHGTKVRLLFEASNLLPVRSFPAATKPDISVLPAVELSNGSSWQAVAADYAQEVERQVRAFNAKEIAAPLVSPADSTKKKASKLLSYLNDNIRYTGLELGQQSLVPAKPSQVLARRYGDCKDKAALLTALLRSSGVEANVALLATGPGLDVRPDLPGLGLFNHAIVYVGGRQPFWIDPSSGYTEPGILPVPDGDRRALVVSKTNGRLIYTPRPSVKKNVQTERVLVEYIDDKRAKISEVVESSGAYSIQARSQFDAPPGQLKTNLKDYAKQRFGAEVEAVNFSEEGETPRLEIQMKEAKLFETVDEGSLAYLTPNSMFEHIPSILLAQEKTGEEKKEKPDPRWRKLRSFPIYVAHPHRRVMEYRLRAPTGFVWDKAMPEELNFRAKKLLLQRSSKRVSDRELLVKYVVELGSRVIPQRHVRLLTETLKQFRASADIQLRMFHSASKLIQDGQYRSAIQLHQRLIQQAEDKALAKARFLEALAGLGFGTEARHRAALLSKEYPEVARVQASHGWTHSLDGVGRQVFGGRDHATAIRRYRRAAELAPEEDAYREHLARLLVYDKKGRLLRDKGQLAEAISILKSLRKQSGTTEHDEQIVRLLFWLGRHEELEGFARGLETRSASVTMMWLASIAQEKGAEAAEKVAVSLGPSEARTLLEQSAGSLALFRKYELILQLLDLPTLRNSKLRQESVRKEYKALAVHTKERPFDGCSRKLKPAARALLAMRRRLLLGNTNAKKEKLRQEKLAGGLYFDKSAVGQLIDQLAPTPSDMVSAPFLLDSEACLQTWKVDVVGDAARVRQFKQASSKPFRTVYLNKAGFAYRIVFVGNSSAGYSRQALAALRAGRPLAARAWLEWAADEFKSWGNRRNDYNIYDAFNDVWTHRALPGKLESERITLAAAALGVWQPNTTWGQQLYDRVAHVFASKPQYPELALAARYSRAMATTVLAPKSGIRLIHQLRQELPLDRQVWRHHIWALGASKQTLAQKKELQSYLKVDADNLWAINRLYEAHLSVGEFDAAQALLKARAREKKAKAQEFNTVAWGALFTDGKLQVAIELAKESARMNKRYSALHTLATLYAEAGEHKKAVDSLNEALDLFKKGEVPSSAWYPLGRIAEGLGITRAAKDLYLRLPKPKNSAYTQTSWHLARERLKQL